MATETAERKPEESSTISKEEKEELEPDKTVERTDTGVSITVSLTRGSGTRDQDKIKAKVKRHSLSQAQEEADEVMEDIKRLGREARKVQPSPDEEDE